MIKIGTNRGTVAARRSQAATQYVAHFAVMVSISKGGSNARRHRYRFVPQVYFGAIALIVLGCIWFMLVQTSKLSNGPPPLTPGGTNAEQVARKDSQIEKEDQAKAQVKIASGVRGEAKAAVDHHAVTEVVCGGHSAPSCAQCPQGNGAGWCHGDCIWCADKEECMNKSDFCPQCQSKATDEASCNKLSQECEWCDMLNQCMHVDSICPKERVWAAPEPEPWFVPPDPIDKYGLTLSVVLPCGSENEFFERTIRSVFAATPPEVLKEIVVVDDNSDPPLEPMFTLDPEEYKVKFVRSDVTLGLIDAKHQGALAATGDIIVFFDCHVKTALGYWEPFVRSIAENPKRVVVPAITSLDVDTWKEFNRPSGGQGGMSKCYITMDSAFKWTSDDKPWVPAMSGGLLAIGRDWFFKIGGHDQAMKVGRVGKGYCLLSYALVCPSKQTLYPVIS